MDHDDDDPILFPFGAPSSHHSAHYMADDFFDASLRVAPFRPLDLLDEDESSQNSQPRQQFEDKDMQQEQPMLIDVPNNTSVVISPRPSEPAQNASPSFSGAIPAPYVASFNSLPPSLTPPTPPSFLQASVSNSQLRTNANNGHFAASSLSPSPIQPAAPISYPATSSSAPRGAPIPSKPSSASSASVASRPSSSQSSPSHPIASSLSAPSKPSEPILRPDMIPKSSGKPASSLPSSSSSSSSSSHSFIAPKNVSASQPSATASSPVAPTAPVPIPIPPKTLPSAAFTFRNNQVVKQNVTLQFSNPSACAASSPPPPPLSIPLDVFGCGLPFQNEFARSTIFENVSTIQFEGYMRLSSLTSSTSTFYSCPLMVRSPKLCSLLRQYSTQPNSKLKAGTALSARIPSDPSALLVFLPFDFTDLDPKNNSTDTSVAEARARHHVGADIVICALVLDKDLRDLHVSIFGSAKSDITVRKNICEAALRLRGAEICPAPSSRTITAASFSSSFSSSSSSSSASPFAKMETFDPKQVTAIFVIEEHFKTRGLHEIENLLQLKEAGVRFFLFSNAAHLLCPLHTLTELFPNHKGMVCMPSTYICDSISDYHRAALQSTPSTASIAKPTSTYLRVLCDLLRAPRRGSKWSLVFSKATLSSLPSQKHRSLLAQLHEDIISAQQQYPNMIASFDPPHGDRTARLEFAYQLLSHEGISWSKRSDEHAIHEALQLADVSHSDARYVVCVLSPEALARLRMRSSADSGRLVSACGVEFVSFGRLHAMITSALQIPDSHASLRHLAPSVNVSSSNPQTWLEGVSKLQSMLLPAGSSLEQISASSAPPSASDTLFHFLSQRQAEIDQMLPPGMRIEARMEPSPTPSIVAQQSCSSFLAEHLPQLTKTTKALLPPANFFKLPPVSISDLQRHTDQLVFMRPFIFANNPNPVTVPPGLAMDRRTRRKKPASSAQPQQQQQQHPPQM